MPFIIFFRLTLLFIGLSIHNSFAQKIAEKPSTGEYYIQVLGVAQDAGYPQLGCIQKCCKNFWNKKETKKHIVSLALVNKLTNQYFLFEATPDIKEQLQMLQKTNMPQPFQLPSGIFITHAHIGHYTGLMQLGREALGANKIPVFAMPKLDSFLRNNGPWSQLVALNNIVLKPLSDNISIQPDSNLKITPIRVPHRDEFSETVGFIIQGPQKKLLFIPDIDKWEKWDSDITDLIKTVDYALLDGTFYKNGELPNRDMREVPHPFVEESIKHFTKLSKTEKKKIIFIHLNHTNPLIRKNSLEKKSVQQNGFQIAEEGMLFKL